MPSKARISTSTKTPESPPPNPQPQLCEYGKMGQPTMLRIINTRMIPRIFISAGPFHKSPVVNLGIGLSPRQPSLAIVVRRHHVATRAVEAMQHLVGACARTTG